MARKATSNSLETELRRLLSAERQLLRALPRMAEWTWDPKVGEALEWQIGESTSTVKKLENRLEELSTRPSTRPSTIPSVKRSAVAEDALEQERSGRAKRLVRALVSWTNRAQSTQSVP